MITNDIDEAILLADTIYTLSSASGATLSAAVNIAMPHPRTRAQLSGHAEYQRARRETFAVLASDSSRNAAAARSAATVIH
jgi:ABC-type nitrate/sulfonate/bicarbonate transport system ATPase subunit